MFELYLHFIAEETGGIVRLVDYLNTQYKCKPPERGFNDVNRWSQLIVLKIHQLS